MKPNGLDYQHAIKLLNGYPLSETDEKICRLIKESYELNKEISKQLLDHWYNIESYYLTRYKLK